MDEAITTVNRRRDQNREAQRRFRERKRKSKDIQSHESTWNQPQMVSFSHNDTSSSAVERLLTSTSITPHEEMVAFDSSTEAAAAALNAMVNQSAVQKNTTSMTSMLGTYRPTSSPRPSSSTSTSPTCPTTMSQPFIRNDSVGTHSLLASSGSQTLPMIETPLTSMDLDFWPTPSHSSTTYSSSESVDLTTLPTSKGTNALHIAARKGNLNIVRILLHRGVDCNEKDHDGLTALMYAILEGHIDVVCCLLSSGATITNDDSTLRQASALHLAVANKSEDILRALLLHCVENEISIDPYNEQGRTPLHEAIEIEYEPAVVMLLHFGADPQSTIGGGS